MPIHSDFTLINNASNSGDWTTNSFDPPILNDSSSTVPNYIVGTSRMMWTLKKGVTNGYTYCSASGNVSTKLVVAWLNYTNADIALIPINAISIRISSSSGFTTNYGQWNALSQISDPKNTSISGHTPVMAYPTNPDLSNGTPNYNSIASVGWVATTGGSADGKQGGFDMFFSISWVGAHSATYNQNYFSSIATDVTPTTIPGTTNRPIGIFSKTDRQIRTNVSLRLGHGSSDTANTVVTEDLYSIYFDNVQPEQEIGWDFASPSGGNQIQLTINSGNHSWNSQPSSAEIYKNMSNSSIVRVQGGSDTRGGKITCRSHISDTDTYFKLRVITQCHPVRPKDMLWDGCTISDAKTIGVIYDTVSDGTRVKNMVYSNNTVSGALEIKTVGNYTLDGDKFSGNVYDIVNSGNASTVTAGSFIVGRAYKILTVGTTDYTAIGSDNNMVGTKFIASGVGSGTGTATEVLLIKAINGANPNEVKVNNTGTNSDTLFQNAVSVTVTVLDDSNGLGINLAHVYLKDSSSPLVIISGATNSSGVITTSLNYSSDISITGWARQMNLSGSDYEPKEISGTITTDGFNTTVRLAPLIN